MKDINRVGQGYVAVLGHFKRSFGDTSPMVQKFGSTAHGFRYRLLVGAIIMILLNGILNGRLCAQEYGHLEKLVSQTEEIQFPEASDDGKWLAWYSVLGDGSRNLQLQHVSDPDLVMERKNVTLMSFIGNHLAVQTGDTLEYLNPASGRSYFLKNVSKFFYNRPYNVYIVLYTAKGGSRAQVFDTGLNLKQTIANVQYLYSKNQEIILRKKTGDLNEVQVLNKGAFETIFSTTDELKNIVPSGMQEKGFVIHTSAAGHSKIHYIAADKKQFILEVSRYSDYDQMTLGTSGSDQQLVIKLEKKVKAKKEMVNIWYGTDFDLAAHNSSVLQSITIGWNPFTGKEIMMTRPGYFGETAIGNNLYLMNRVDPEQVDRMDKAGGAGFDKLYLWNALTDTYTFISDLQKEMVISPSGRSLLIQQEDSWQLYNTTTLVVENLNISSEAMPYFTSDSAVLWVGGNMIAEHNLNTRKIREIFRGKHLMIELVDFKKVYAEIGNKRDFRTADLKKALVVKITDKESREISYAYLKNRKLHTILPNTSDQITEFKQLGQEEKYFWIAENYNKRPTIMIKNGTGNPETIYVSDAYDRKFEQAELRTIYYKGADGEITSGALYMPLNFDRTKKYPVVIHVYEKQDYLTKRFLRPSFSNPTGYNIPLLMEEGFAVLLADISQSDKGAGISALESIHHALDELQKIDYIDMARVGLMGQSFGGYETNFIATHSSRFAAYVSGAAVSDVIRTYYAYNYNFHAPDYYRYEGRQYWFKKTIAEDPEKYIRNNPIMYAQNVSAPMLLWTGTDDGNVSPEGTKSMFIALRKYRKPVIALFYDKERHSLGKSVSQKDLTVRILDWFNYHLKGQENIPWIRKYIKGAE